MRAGILLSLAFAACTSTGAPDSVRERLESDATQLVVTADSTGTITAQRRASGSWAAGSVKLAVRAGELVASADARGSIRIEHLAVDLGPIEIPKSVLGYAAQLTDVHLESKRPVGVPTWWTGDDEARGMAPIELALTWSLTIDGKTSPLGAPDLPPVPVELVLTGDGADVHAEARALSAGTFWSWADLVKLADLHLVLAAGTVTP
ncbi:MAG TPA: hypothetical protein VN253_16845 [Kofleriaceae bacterium]|nr:hypothetical protein [Kofleriaceae bacterium]